MKKRLPLLALILLFVINIAALATLSYNRWFKSRWDTGGQWSQSESWQDLKSQVALSPEQSQTLQAQRLSFEQEVAPLRVRMQEKRNALLEEARNPSPDLRRVDTLIEEIGLLQMNIQKLSFRNLMHDKNHLTPGQQQRYFSLFEEHMGRRGWGRRVRGAGRRGPRWQRENQY